MRLIGPQAIEGKVGTSAIDADAITSAKIADDQIDSEHYVDGSIDTAHIAANQIDGTLTKDALIADYSDVTITAADLIMYGDATDSNNTKRDTVQGILDLASGGRTLISTQTVALAAEAALIAVTAGIDSTYNIYEWILTEVETSVDNIKSYMRCYTGSASEETGSIYSYHYNITAADGTGYGGIYADGATAGMEVARAHGTGTGEIHALRVTLYNPAGTAHYKIVEYSGGTHNSNGYFQANRGGGVFETTTAVTGLNIKPSSGYIGCTAALYGIAKS